MRRNLALILTLILFFIVYNILLLKFLPKEVEREEKNKKIKVEPKSLNIPEDEKILIENEYLRIFLLKKGGIIKEIELKKFRDFKNEENLKIYVPNFITPLDTLLELNKFDEKSVVFKSKDGLISKEFLLLDGYKLKVKFKNVNFFLFSFLPTIDPIDEKNYNLIEYKRGSIKKHNLKNFSDIDFGGENTLWVGSETKYFIQVIIKPEYFKKIVKAEGYREGKFFKFITETVDSFYTFIGPKDYFILKKEGYLLYELYPLGFWIIKPFTLFILYSFKWFYGTIKLSSIVIFVFTLLMKIIFMPLTIKSMRAMKKMEDLKPRLEALRKIYKDDPKKLNEEVLKLYKEKGVNPFSGCFPLLLQLPVFWALYQVLTNEIMFRGKELFLWIKDLSSRDPFYVLPILMGLTSLLQQFLQPSQDEQTRRIGIFMSIFITIIFLNLPAGLVYYWLLYNILGIFESLLIKRRIQR
ncbi:MAG: membrane protein insertase YidC [Candidatus Hydrothermales bacterium]